MRTDSFLYKFYYQWWKNIDKSIFFIISLLFIIGLFFSLVSTSLIASDKLNTNSYFFFFKHLIYVVIGVFIVFIFSSLKKEQLIKYSIVLFFVSLISLVLVPIIGVEVKGSKRWIDLFFLPRFQPIEVLKPFLIVFLAAIFSTEKTNIEVVHILCDLLDEIKPLKKGKSYKDQIIFIGDRPGHDRRYAIDATKIKQDLGWKSNETFDTGIRKTIQWYIDNQEWVKNIQSGDYMK